MKNIKNYLVLIAVVIGLLSGCIKSESVTSLGSNINLVQFTHGEISCEPLQPSIQDSGVLLINAPIDVSCQKTFKVTTDTCDVRLRLEDDIIVEREIKSEICDINGNLYTSTDYSNCVEVPIAKTNDIIDTGRSGFFADKKGAIYLLRTNLPSGKVLRIKSINKVLPFSSFDEGLFSVFITYRPYGIYKRDTMQGSGVLKTQNCIAIPDDIDNKLVIQATDSSEYTNLFNKKNYMFANQKIDYISRPVLVPFTTEKVKLINGKYGYCQAKQSVTSFAYYGLEMITVFDSNKYYYVGDDILQDVECCTGDKTIGQTCVGEHWVDDDDEISCSTTNPCPIRFETKYGEKQVYYQKCVNGQCNNIVRTVECTSNLDCKEKEGGICRADFTCFYRSSGCVKNADCLEGEICKDGACTKKYYTLIWVIVIAAFTIILTIVIISINNRKRKKK